MSFWFGDFELDQERRQLLRSGEPVPLEPKAYELLSLLLERRPRALSRAQIRDVIWPQTFVSESTLAVVEVRALPGDWSFVQYGGVFAVSPDGQWAVVTVERVVDSDLMLVEGFR